MKLIFLSAFMTLSAFAADKSVMNGISFKKYAGFEQKWKLVTVRYRKDNRELRFVYANPIAMRAMDLKMKKYPEGAVFAKVAYLAQPDPAFESSLAPSESRRFQFMVKDSQKYKKHNGWGYALFNSYGEMNPEPQDQQVNACASCHNVIPERDYVFSWKFNQVPSKNLNLFKYTHEEVNKKDLPQNIATLLPEKMDMVLKVISPMTKDVFQGTLDELKPSLARLSVNAKKPVLFLSDDQKKFTLIYPEDLTIECDDEGVKGLFVVSINSMLNNTNNKVHFCQSYH